MTQTKYKLNHLGVNFSTPEFLIVQVGWNGQHSNAFDISINIPIQGSPL